jgi:hypothetical protein
MDFVPIQLYYPIYYNIILLIVVITFIHTQSQQIGSNSNISFMRYFGYLTLFFVVIYMGLRPLHAIFIDMGTYAALYREHQSGYIYITITDAVFNGYVSICSKIMSVQMFFFVSTLLYVWPLYIICKKWFKSYWFYAFVFLIASLSFWAYGVNGIRNGIAGSLLLLGMSRAKRFYQIIFIILAIGFHKSMLLPALGFLVTHFYNKPKTFFIFWLLSIPLSLISGGFWESYFSGLSIVDDDRLSYLTAATESGAFRYAGFRWDFLFYSASAVFAGWYYIGKKEFNDKFYWRLFNTFVFANAFWILVIRANFTNRFAYLSWFMMALVIVYPLLKQNIILNQHRKTGFILIGYFMFTYVFNFLLK